MIKMKKLIEVDSLHEQREKFGNPDILIEKGVWIEIVAFNQTTEKVAIKHRWEVEKVEYVEEKNIRNYKIICKKLNIKEYEDKKIELAKRVFEKHKIKLKASFVKCLVEGISVCSSEELRGILVKLGGDEKNENKQKSDK